MNLQIGEDGYCDEFDNNNIITLNNNEDEVIKVATLANGVSIMIRDILCHDEYFQQLEEVKVEGKMKNFFYSKMMRCRLKRIVSYVWTWELYSFRR